MAEFILGARPFEKPKDAPRVSISKDPFAQQLTGVQLDRGQVRDAAFIAAETTALCTAIIITSQAAEHLMGLELGKTALDAMHSVGLAAWAGIIRGVDILSKPTVGTSRLEKFLNP